MQNHRRAIPRASRRIVPRLLRASLYLLAFVLLCISYWIHRYFGTPDLNQIAYHLSFGVDLARTADPVFLRHFMHWCVLAPLIFATLLCSYERRILRTVLKVRHGLRPWCRKLHGYFPLLLIVGAMVFWVVDVSALKYATANYGPDYFGANYVNPGSQQLVAHSPKNLILIYIESLEAGYADRAAFGHDLLAPLTSLQGTSFADYAQAPGTGWTIAALVATQCGVPLERVTIFDGNTQGQMVHSFLGTAVCLPDLLAERGYRNVFMGGAALSFAGKDKFLQQHHYHEVYGKEEWLRQGMGAADMNGWGLYDDQLFKQAKAKLRTLAQTQQHFNLTLLTVDTHEPEGYLSRSCARGGFDAFGGVVSCTALEVADFVKFARDNGYLETTNIVILGDHLARNNPLSAQLTQRAHRTIFNTFVSAAMPAPNRAQVLHFDMFPTILELTGFATGDGRLGLGYSAINAHAPAPPPARLRDMEKDLLNRSNSYLALWAQARR